MHTGLEDRTKDFPKLAAYFAERARGGVGLMVTGGFAPNIEGWLSPFASRLASRRAATSHRVVTDAVRAHPPSHVRNRLPKILYATQVAVAPPTFVIFVNDPALIHFSYRRYLENRIRDEFGFLGTPIRIILRKRESEEAARKSSRPRSRRRVSTSR